MRATPLKRVPVDSTDSHDVVDDITFSKKTEWAGDADLTTKELEPMKPIPCVVAPFSESTYRSSQNNTSMDNIILSINEYLEMKAPYYVDIDTSNLITNIVDRNNNVIWKEEEADGRPTTFKVVGVSPVLDPFNQPVSKLIVLRRAQVQ